MRGGMVDWRRREWREWLLKGVVGWERGMWRKRIERFCS